MTTQDFPLTLEPSSRLGDLVGSAGDAVLPGATWYEAEASGAGLAFSFPPGTLADAACLTADWLLDGIQLAVFAVELQEGEDGLLFRMSFGLLNQCAARMRVPLEAVDQNRWRYPREGAWLKPLCSGDRVDLAQVDRMRLVLVRKGPDPVRFCVTPVVATTEGPPLLENPTLPQGPLLDELGQSTLHDWPQKTGSVDELQSRLEEQRAGAGDVEPPAGFSRWGGWRERRVEATGFFRTHHDGERWWLVDPDGYLFWSSGLDCVQFGIDTAYGGLETALTWLPDRDGTFAAAHVDREAPAFDYLRANFIRAFGAEEAEAAWAEIALAQLREFGFNTVANWSDWRIAVGRVPYVRPMDGRMLSGLPSVYRDFPDVYHPGFAEAAEAFAAPLAETADDPAFIGYFLMNEPNWGFAGETPAAGMLYTTESCYARQALVEALRERYGTDARLAEAWGMDVTLARVASGRWRAPLTDAAQADLAAFSEEMVARYFETLSAACRRVDPNHLNLGIRYYTIPPAWAVKGMRSFDVLTSHPQSACVHHPTRSADAASFAPPNRARAPRWSPVFRSTIVAC